MEEDTKKSGVKGVTWNAKNRKWVVKLSSEYLGSFDNLEDAIQKRKEAETQKNASSILRGLWETYPVNPSHKRNDLFRGVRERKRAPLYEAKTSGVQN